MDRNGMNSLSKGREEVMRSLCVSGLVLILGSGLFSGLQAQAGEPKTAPSLRSKATIETSLGSFEVELFDEDAPRTVENFVKLAEKNFFDGLRVHRVVKGTLIQTGDEKTKDL